MTHKRALVCVCVCVFTVMSHQALLDVADIRKKVADCRNLVEKKKQRLRDKR